MACTKMRVPIKATQRRRFRKTTDSHHGCPVAANILDQNFACDGQDQKWGVDISYIWTAEGWLYLAIVPDLFSRRIIGWAVSDRLKKELALNALRRAITIRQPSAGLIHYWYMHLHAFRPGQPILFRGLSETSGLPGNHRIHERP